MADRPAPFTTPEMDVRELDGFMFNVERVMASELFALSTGDEFKAAVALWSRAWKQVPAGSLPNDERILCAFSGAGSKWRKVREMALRGFVECSDGRLYHRVLCEDVYRAWSAKQKFEDNKSGNSERKKKEREERSQLFAGLKTCGVTPAWNATTQELRQLVTQHVTDLSQPVTVTGHTPVTPPVTVTVTAITCNGNGTGQDDKESGRQRERAQTLLSRLCEILRIRLEDDPERLTWQRQIEEAFRDGLTETELIKATETARTNGKISFPYIRAVAMKPTKSPEEKPNGSGPERTKKPSATDSHLAGIADLVGEIRAGRSG